MTLSTMKVYRHTDKWGSAAPGAGDSVGKPLTDAYRHILQPSVLSVPVGKRGTDAISRASIGRRPLVGVSVRF